MTRLERIQQALRQPTTPQAPYRFALEDLQDMVDSINSGETPYGLEKVICPKCGATGFVPVGGSGPMVCGACAYK